MLRVKTSLLIVLLALNAATAHAEQSASKLLRIGLMHELGGNFEGATAKYEQVRKQAEKPHDDRDATLGIGRVLRKRRKFREAIEVLSPLVAVDRKEPVEETPGLSHLVALELSKCYASLKDHETALRWAMAARDKYPRGLTLVREAGEHGYTVKGRIARLLLDLDHRDEALKIAEEGIVLFGDYNLLMIAVDILDQKGELAARREKWAAEMAEEKKLLEIEDASDHHFNFMTMHDVVRYADLKLQWKELPPQQLWSSFVARNNHLPRIHALHHSFEDWHLEGEYQHLRARPKTFLPICRTMTKHGPSHAQAWAFLFLIEAGEPPKFEEVERILMDSVKTPPPDVKPDQLNRLRRDYFYLLTLIDFDRAEKILRREVEADASNTPPSNVRPLASPAHDCLLFLGQGR